MDICMLTPSERTILQELVAKYEAEKGELLAFLRKLHTEWDAEYEKASTEWARTQAGHDAWVRIDNAELWIYQLEEGITTIEDLEPKVAENLNRS